MKKKDRWVQDLVRAAEEGALAPWGTPGSGIPDDSKGCTIDGYIAKHGRIESHADGSFHKTKKSYLDNLKKNNCFIKD
jgi:hypothetical protein